MTNTELIDRLEDDIKKVAASRDSHAYIQQVFRNYRELIKQQEQDG